MVNCFFRNRDIGQIAIISRPSSLCIKSVFVFDLWAVVSDELRALPSARTFLCLHVYNAAHKRLID